MGILDELFPLVQSQESQNNPYARSPKGAFGLMQLMPATAANPGFGIQPVSNNSPEENQRVGQEYLSALYNKYNNNVPEALMAYNWGPGHVDKWLAAGSPQNMVPSETQNYVSRIMQRLEPNAAVSNAGAKGDFIAPQQASIGAPMGQNTQDNSGGIFGIAGGNQNWSALGPALMALGGGIAAGGAPGGGGWGAGLGQGFQDAGNVVGQMFRRNLEMQRLAMDRYSIVARPDGSQVVFDKVTQRVLPLDSQTQIAGATPGAAPAGAATNQAPTIEQAANAPTAPNPMRGSSLGVGQIAATGKEALSLATQGRENAVKANSHLDTLSSALDKLPTTGPLSAGPFEETAADTAGKMNDVARRLYLPLPFNQEQIGNLELAGKEAKLAGLSQGRSNFGASREGQQTIQLLQHTVPNPTMSPLGRRQIVAQQRALNQRDIDFADFLDAWMKNPSHPGDPTGAQQAFDQFRPPKYYADLAEKEVAKYDTSGQSAEEASRQNAREAIAKGYPRDKVIARLKEKGYNAAGL